MANLILTCKPFQLVHFTSSGKSEITRTVDITLLKWIKYDDKKKQFLTKYMPPPYTEETNKLLYDLIQNNSDIVDNNWPNYVVKIVGHADTYEQAVMRLNELKIKEFAYTESEVDPGKKAKLATSQIKLQLKSLPDLKNIMNLSTIGEPQPSTSKEKSTNLSNFKKQRNSTTFSDKAAVNSQNSIKRKKKKQNSGVHRKKIVDSDSSSNSDSVPNKRRREMLKNNSSTRNKIIVDSGSSDNGDSVFNNRNKKEAKKNFNTQENPIREFSDDEDVSPDLDFGLTDFNAYEERKSLGNPRRTTENVKEKICDKKNNSRESKYEKNFSSVMREIKSLRIDIKDVHDNTKLLIGMLENLAILNLADKKSFEAEYNLILPLQTFDDVEILNQKLANEDCNKHFKATLQLSLSKDVGVRKVLNAIIKKYLCRDIVLKLTATKPSPGKTIFKNMKMCSSLLEVATEKFQISDDEVLSHLGIIFGNAKDWDGHRNRRKNDN
ncbi:uncharacterized protein LOC127289166 [Leptopilina boulardi]|uniref:uncharacterized protein LOC127284018 n=1 Tax=Leptopilina boulardi TaxID=63433 RepID=UPI0021F5D0B2|nr:uncharacterized protein LOC127284018 [Leptopilina boulardi]XP_051165240.1 uncharacterized protein LOC127284018 [Leptopilina boulardi]XP_051172917.1 uncharacterized protein LOC127289166 [Leptopilina boulardi]XP_051172918.1 uncharacterized protein LOC127289166 [Leptopilina boulardi]